MKTFFGENLKYLRTQKGWKQKEIPDNTGFSSSTWGNYEAGLSTPNFKDLIKIAQIFGVSETDLIHKNFAEGNVLLKDVQVIKGEKGNVNSNPSRSPNQQKTGTGTDVNQSITSLTSEEAVTEIEKIFNQQLEQQKTANNAILALLRHAIQGN